MKRDRQLQSRSGHAWIQFLCAYTFFVVLFIVVLPGLMALHRSGHVVLTWILGTVAVVWLVVFGSAVAMVNGTIVAPLVVWAFVGAVYGAMRLTSYLLGTAWWISLCIVFVLYAVLNELVFYVGRRLQNRSDDPAPDNEQ